MTKFKYIYLFAGLLLLATSCTTYRKAANTAPVNVQMNITMSDVDYVGEVTGSATQSYVLGLPLGGRRYYTAQVGVSGGSILSAIVGDRGLSNALYDAMQQKPDADFFMPINMEVKRNQMFLGSKRTYSVKGKAFKIKTK